MSITLLRTKFGVLPVVISMPRPALLSYLFHGCERRRSSPRRGLLICRDESPHRDLPSGCDTCTKTSRPGIPEDLWRNNDLTLAWCHGSKSCRTWHFFNQAATSPFDLHIVSSTTLFRPPSADFLFNMDFSQPSPDLSPSNALDTAGVYIKGPPTDEEPFDVDSIPPTQEAPEPTAAAPSDMASPSRDLSEATATTAEPQLWERSTEDLIAMIQNLQASHAQELAELRDQQAALSNQLNQLKSLLDSHFNSQLGAINSLQSVSVTRLCNCFNKSLTTSCLSAHRAFLLSQPGNRLRDLPSYLPRSVLSYPHHLVKHFPPQVSRQSRALR